MKRIEGSKIYKATIFDLDGTLIDSVTTWDDVGQNFLRERGIIPPDNLNEIMQNMSFEQSAGYFIKYLGVNLTINEIITGFNKMAEDKYKNFIELKPYVKEYLQKLKTQNLKLCVVTAADKTLTIEILRRLEVMHHFEFVSTCGESSCGKDDPKIYIQAAKRLGHPIEDIVVFEDALYAIKTAHHAGFDVIGVYDASSIGNIDEIKKISKGFIYSFEEME